MTCEWLCLKQDNKTVDEYEREFSRLLRFAREGYRENERMMAQKFQNGLNPEIHLDVKMFELTTLVAMVHKTRVIKRNKLECKKKTPAKSQYLGKRPAFSSPSTQSYGQSSGYKGKK